MSAADQLAVVTGDGCCLLTGAVLREGWVGVCPDDLGSVPGEDRSGRGRLRLGGFESAHSRKARPWSPRRSSCRCPSVSTWVTVEPGSRPTRRITTRKVMAGAADTNISPIPVTGYKLIGKGLWKPVGSTMVSRMLIALGTLAESGRDFKSDPPADVVDDQMDRVRRRSLDRGGPRSATSGQSGHGATPRPRGDRYAVIQDHSRSGPSLPNERVDAGHG